MAKEELENFFHNLKKEENQRIEKLFQSTLNICINNNVLEQEIQKLFQKHIHVTYLALKCEASASQGCIS